MCSRGCHGHTENIRAMLTVRFRNNYGKCNRRVDAAKLGIWIQNMKNVENQTNRSEGKARKSIYGKRRQIWKIWKLLRAFYFHFASNGVKQFLTL